MTAAMKTNIKRIVGARNSQLSIMQSKTAINRLQELRPQLQLELQPMSSPGDRDRQTDLRISDPDFFTRDLDTALLKGEIDAAMHSAKDLSNPLADGIDYFWLPWREDPRDALVLPRGAEDQLPANARFGISSDRRSAWCKNLCTDAQLLPIRGNCEQRIKLMDDGKFDGLIMAAAALNRLGLEDRINRIIPLTELPVPDGQGYLALTFRSGDAFFNKLRQLFVHPVVFAGAGIGEGEHCTMAVKEALEQCDICLYDALCPKALLQYLPTTATTVYVGKREGAHSIKQNEICDLLTQYARQGRRVVRLKGGDPSIFGRLAEECDILDTQQLPFRVLPGISSLSVAAASTGLLPTRRGLSRGFMVSTPRQAKTGAVEWPLSEERNAFTKILFMAAHALSTLIGQLKSDGIPTETPVSIVYGAGMSEGFTVSGTLETIEPHPDTTLPGLVIIGGCANPDFLFSSHALLSGQRVLYAGSESLAKDAQHIISDFGATPLLRPMLNLRRTDDAAAIVNEAMKADWIILPSPNAIDLFFEQLKVMQIDLRRLPCIAVSGPRSGEACRKWGIEADIVPERHFGRAGLAKDLLTELETGSQVLRICSDRSGPHLSDTLRPSGAEIIDRVFYRNAFIQYDELPEFDSILFTSPSSLKAYLENAPKESLEGKTAGVIGDPTRKKFAELNCPGNLIQGPDATLPQLLLAIAASTLQ